MPRKRATKKKDEDEEDKEQRSANTTSETMEDTIIPDPDVSISPEDVEIARKALLSAVRGSNHDETTALIGKRPNGMTALLTLFSTSFSHKNNFSSSSVCLREEWSPSEQRKVLFHTIQTGWSSNTKQANRFFTGLLELVQSILTPPDEESSLDYLQDKESLDFLALVAQCLTLFLEGRQAARKESGRTTTTPSSPLSMPESTVTLTQALHDCLFALNVDTDESLSSSSSSGDQHRDSVIETAKRKTQAAILRLCEAWWLANATSRENLVSQTLPILVHAVNLELIIHAPGSAVTVRKHVKRLYQMRQALEAIDYADPSSDALRHLLLRVASSPSCLKLPEGKRFLAFVLIMDDGVLVPETHQAIRVQLPHLTNGTILEAYAEIYFKAWKEAPSEMIRERLESIALNDLAYSALHAAKPETAKALLTILKPFHEASHQPDVRTLLFQLYGPILWRSLTATNATVRVNAANVLAQVFPLSDPSSKSTKDDLDKGCQSLQTLLKDRDERVRVAGSQAMLHILFHFWDVIDSTHLRGLLNIIVMEHLSDASSWRVRVAAVQTMGLLLKAPQAHAVLRALLPKVGNLIHDSSEKVRLAVVQLLQQVKDTKGFKYFHVVPVEHLNARLAEEGRRHASTGPVALGLTALLANSYFPQKTDGLKQQQQLSRCLHFLEHDPEAAKVFYANLAVHVPLRDLVKLIGLLFRGVVKAVHEDHTTKETRQPGRKRNRRPDDSEEEEDDDDEQDDASQNQAETHETDQPLRLSASNTALMANVTEIICVLWQSVEKDIFVRKNEALMKFLEQIFSGPSMLEVLTHFEDKARHLATTVHQEDLDESCQSAAMISQHDDCSRVCTFLLQCAGKVPSLASDDRFLSHVYSALTSLSYAGKNNGKSSFSVTAYLALLCQWDKTQDVVSMLASSLELMFPDQDHELTTFASPDGETKKRRRGRKAKNGGQTILGELDSHVALNALLDIFQGLAPSSELTRDYILSSQSTCDVIAKVLERGLKYAEFFLLASDPPTKSLAFEADAAPLVSVCEAYGRFILHKEAFYHIQVDLCAEASQFLEWTTNKVVPVLARSKHVVPTSPFHVTDVSQIAAERSFAISACSPMSPLQLGPPKRRANRNNTPDRMDTDKEPSFDRGDDRRPLLSLEAFAAALVYSSCVIFSEWLAVGGSGAEEITTAAIQWVDAVYASEQKEEFQRCLIKAFCRLAIVLCETGQKFGLLQRLFVHCCDDMALEKGLIQRVVNGLLSGKRGNGVRQITDCIMNAAIEVQSDCDSMPAFPSCPENTWLSNVGGLGEAFSCIFSNKGASMALATRLVQTLEDQNGKTCSASTVFNAKCLWMMCRAKEGSCYPEVADIVRRLDLEKCCQDDGLQTGLRDLLSHLCAS